MNVFSSRKQTIRTFPKSAANALYFSIVKLNQSSENSFVSMFCNTESAHSRSTFYTCNWQSALRHFLPFTSHTPRHPPRVQVQLQSSSRQLCLIHSPTIITSRVPCVIRQSLSGGKWLPEIWKEVSIKHIFKFEPVFSFTRILSHSSPLKLSLFDHTDC